MGMVSADGGMVGANRSYGYCSFLERGLIKFNELKTVGILGSGAFGVVELKQHKKTKEYYAMKVLSKGHIVMNGNQAQVVQEKDVMIVLNSPFIVKLFETFNDANNLYLLMELASGGELMTIYQRKSLHGSDEHARFYIAGVAFAFEHIHSHSIIYRDLKPENLLISAKGYIKLADMGLANQVEGFTWTACR